MPKFITMSTNKFSSDVLFFKIATLEGWSYLILLFVAMPFKYLLGIPELVKFTGWAHGVLFVAYMILLLQAAIANSWKITFVAWAFVAAFIPFATFKLHAKSKS